MTATVEIPRSQSRNPVVKVLLWFAAIGVFITYLAIAILIRQSDFPVYRAGGIHVFDGQLYTFHVAGLPFTYPPFSALLFAPLAPLPLRLAQGIWMVISLIGLWLVVRLTMQRFASAKFAANVQLQLLVFVLVAVSDPLRDGLALGQIDILVALLVIADLAGALSRIPRGVLIGIAAAIKLTPLFLIAYLLVVRRWRDAAVAAGTFAVLTLGTFLVLPSASMTYWIHGYFVNLAHWDLGKVSNQSINGLIVRLLGTPVGASRLWLPAALIVAGVVLWTARRVVTTRPWVAESMALATIVAISPLSWIHHWVYVLPLVVAGIRLGLEPKFRVVLVATSALAINLLIGSIWFVNHASRTSVLSLVVGSSDILLLLIVLGAMAWTLRAPQPRQVDLVEPALT